MKTEEGEEIYVKPMNCPHHHLIYASRPRSYRDLPLRLAEYGTCYRYEKSGELFGLMRVRSLQMNDAHIYCRSDQVQEEFLAVIDLYRFYFDLFGIKKYLMRLSLHAPERLGEKYVDNGPLWVKTEAQVRQALLASGVEFVEAKDEAAFYGPKLDVEVWSSIGREFTLATNQLDFAVPPRFGLTYTDKDGQEKTPLVIHRAPLGTHERFVGFLIEHYAGVFPLWLAPVQVRLATVGKEFVPFAMELREELVSLGVRVELDDSDEKVGKKIHSSSAMKIPWTIVIGEKEVKGAEFQIRVFGEEQPLIRSRLALVEELKKSAVAPSSFTSRPLPPSPYQGEEA
jgi:threonyl-tRNA synthetase